MDRPTVLDIFILDKIIRQYNTKNKHISGAYGLNKQIISSGRLEANMFSNEGP